MNRKKRYLASSDHHAVISDIMVGLVFVFILIIVIFATKFSQAMSENQKFQEARTMFLQQLKEHMEGRGVSIIIDPKLGILRLPENILFAVGKAQLNDKGKRSVKILAEKLKQLLAGSSAICFESVFIEGHSDEQPLRNEPKRKFKTNLNLSAQRAINTYQVMKKHIANLRNNHQHHLFGVVGYGKERPVRVRPQGQRELKEWHRDNRRITMRFSNCIPQILQ